MAKILTIQPLKQQNGAMPYPYFVNLSTGQVLRQDVWRGQPLKLIGFADGSKQEICLAPEEIKKPSQIAENLRPVFADKFGMFRTYQIKAEYTISDTE